MWVWKADLSLDNNWIQQSRQRSFLRMQSNKQGQREEVRKGLKKLLLLFGYTFKDNVFSFSERSESVQQHQQAPTGQPARGAVVIHIHLCTKPFLALKWRTVRLGNSSEQQQHLNAFKTRTVYWAVEPGSWWQMSPSQLTPDLKSSTSEKGVSWSLFPYKICNSQPLHHLNWQDHSKQHPLGGEQRNQLLASI